MSEHEVVQTDLVVNDKASGALSKIASIAGRASSAVNGMLNVISGMVGIGGLFAIGHAISDIDSMYKAVGRVKAVTGMAAESSYALLETFKLNGIEVGTAERIVTRMARKTEQMDEGWGGGVKGASALYKRLGIDIKAGPEAQMLAMAKAAEEHKVNIADLGRAWGVPVGQAGQMLKMLQKGPAAMKEMMGEAKNSSGVINEEALKQYQNMQKNKREMSAAWENLVGTLYKAVIPAFAEIMHVVTATIKKWEPAIKRIADFLLKHMTTIVGLAGKFAKLMVVHQAARALGLGGVGGLATKGVGLVGRAAGWAKKGYDGGLGGMGSVLKVIGKFSLLGVALLAIVGVVAYVKRHWDTLGPKIMAVVKKIVSAFSHLWTALEPIAEWIGDKLVKVFVWLADAMATVADKIGDAVDWVVEVVKKIGRLLGVAWELLKNPMNAQAIIAKVIPAEAKYAQDAATASILKGAMRVNDEAVKKAKEWAGKKGDGTPDGRPPGVTNDFRGSHFDIRQNFAEGFDPDRIAAAFSSDLAKLGDRKVQSGLSPLYAAGLR